jgi:DNA polymerase elongation subunit (family B)
MKINEMDGRVTIDLMKVIQRDHKLDTYKLDNVSTVFMQGAIKSLTEGPDDTTYLYVDNTQGLHADAYIKLGNENKVLVLSVNDICKQVQIKGRVTLTKPEMTWGLAKDDLSPHEMFELQKGTAEDRAKIARYCIKDCQLCNFLINKLQILPNNFGMSNVCSVPLSYIFLRGQGIKIFSLVSKQCAQDGFLIPLIRAKEENEEDDGYEGAIVLDPVPGIYIDDPISVLDYASLYPSSMISENISHDSIILDPTYDNLPGYDYINIMYDLYEGEGDKKQKVGERVCRYAQFPNNEKGIIPRILQKLLVARKTTR